MPDFTEIAYELEQFAVELPPDSVISAIFEAPVGMITKGPANTEIKPWDGQLVTLIDMEQTVKLAEMAINRIRVSFLGGIISEVEARNELASIPIVQTRIDQDVEKWLLIRHPAHKTLTSAQIVSLVIKRVIGPVEALTRLRNIGYSQDDATLILGTTVATPRSRNRTPAPGIVPFNQGLPAQPPQPQPVQPIQAQPQVVGSVTLPLNVSPVLSRGRGMQ